MKRNLVGKILGKIKVFVQDFVPIKTALPFVFKEYTARLDKAKAASNILFISWHFMLLPRTSCFEERVPSEHNTEAASVKIYYPVIFQREQTGSLIYTSRRVSPSKGKQVK